jgi:hypothetical protein
VRAGRRPGTTVPSPLTVDDPMFPATFTNDVNYYLRFYRDYALERWNEMTPMQYGLLLISIAVFGWLLMKSGIKS